MNGDQPLAELAEEPTDETVEGEHIRVVRYRCPRCSKRATVRISESLEKAAFRCVGCGYVIVT